MRALGRKSFASFVLRCQVVPSFWLRRLSERRQRSMIRKRNVPSAQILVGTAWYAKKPVTNLLQPLPLVENCVMPPLSHLLLNFLDLRPHAVASGFPFDLESSVAACSAN